MTTATLRAVGNSVAVVIPKQWLSVLGLEAGAKVDMKLEGDQLTLQAKSKAARKKYKLSDLLAKCDPDAPMPQEIKDWENMPAVGNEVW